MFNMIGGASGNVEGVWRRRFVGVHTIREKQNALPIDEPDVPIHNDEVERNLNVSATRSSLKVPGTELAVVTQGSGPTLVLVHGTGVDGSTWNRVAQELSQDFTVVSYDRRGYGQSIHDPILDHRIHADDLIALIESLNIGKVLVVGWSSGGVLALDAITRRPDLISRLIVMEAPAQGMRSPSLGMISMMMKMGRLEKKGKSAEAVSLFYDWASSTKDGSSGYARATEDVRKGLDAYAPVVLTELKPSKFGPLGGHIDYKGIKASSVPVTWFLGGDSFAWYGRLAKRAARVASNIKIRQISNGSHMMHLEVPDTFVSAVKEELLGKQ
jgi:pimeloyl-ACP methyl ester carboxylesterase